MPMRAPLANIKILSSMTALPEPTQNFFEKAINKIAEAVETDTKPVIELASGQDSEIYCELPHVTKEKSVTVTWRLKNPRTTSWPADL